VNTLLVEPDYYTKYPPLGLLKLASFHRSQGDQIFYVRGINNEIDKKIRKIEITSLFTFAWKPVHEAIDFYHRMFSEADITAACISASLMPDHI